MSNEIKKEIIINQQSIEEIVTPLMLSDIRSLIDNSKKGIAKVVSSSMTLLYWRIGSRVQRDILNFDRAEYGQQIIRNIAKSLTLEYGQGFSYSSITRMVKFYQQLNEPDIVATVSQQLSWSHIIELLPIEEDNKRYYYMYMAISEGWSVRSLRSNINKMSYERSSIAKKPEAVTTALMGAIKTGNVLPPEFVLKDPYCLEFLGLPDQHYESDLENAILQQIEKFILELGAGFSFVARQKKMVIGNDHFYLDMLFFNRKLKRLVAIELKSTHFKAEYKGQMELYLGWLKKHESMEGENPPIGIILCSEKSEAQIELLDISSNNEIHVAEYWTELPPIDVFQKKIQQIVLEAKESYSRIKKIEQE